MAKNNNGKILKGFEIADKLKDSDDNTKILSENGG